MTRDSFSYTHGDNGSQPGSARDFQIGKRPNAEDFDWWWSTVTSYINGHADEFDRFDSDDDGIVDEADHAATADNATSADSADYADDGDASTYKGNDIDTDGNGNADLADETKSFEARTNYPSNPEAGRVVFRTDKT